MQWGLQTAKQTPLSCCGAEPLHSTNPLLTPGSSNPALLRVGAETLELVGGHAIGCFWCYAAVLSSVLDPQGSLHTLAARRRQICQVQILRTRQKEEKQNGTIVHLGNHLRTHALPRCLSVGLVQGSAAACHALPDATLPSLIKTVVRGLPQPVAAPIRSQAAERSGRGLILH